LNHFAVGTIGHVLSLRVFLSIPLPFEEHCTYTKTHTSSYTIPSADPALKFCPSGIL
jgi:hypothetical protein